MNLFQISKPFFANLGLLKHDIYKDRKETKKAWREVCICLQEDFEVLVGVKKTLLVSIAIIY